MGWGLALNGILLGAVLALACKKHNDTDPLGAWRWIAATAGAIFPFTELLFGFVGPGTSVQGFQGITWSLLLMPVYAVALAGFFAMLARVSWEETFPPVVSGLAATWCLAALTEPGIFPLALLLDWRLALAVLSRFDVVLAGLCIVGLGMAYSFRVYDRDLARLTVICAAGYVAVAGFWSWQAWSFGAHYANVQGISHPVVRVVPQMFSPMNWRVVVAEPSGRLHDTLVTLGRGGNREKDTTENPFRPRNEAVWRIHRRYGDTNVPEETQRQVRLAWYGWQATPFAWLGRYAVFERLYAPQEAGIGVACVGFRDFRAQTQDEIVAGTFVVCPVGNAARVFQPQGSQDKKGNWPGMRELVGFADARR